MSYCKKEDLKATLTYSFNGNKNTVIFKPTPIDVTTGTRNRLIPVSQQNEYQLYNVNYTITRPNYAETTTDTQVYKGKITGVGVDADPNRGYSANNNWAYSFYIIAQGYSNFSSYSEPTRIYISNAFGNPHGEITINWISPLDNQDSICTIQVSIDGNVVYKDEGDCPVTFDIVCGEGCPPGTTKCFSTNYPGYCCLPCNEMASEIKAIASQVRGLNHG